LTPPALSCGVALACLTFSFRSFCCNIKCIEVAQRSLHESCCSHCAGDEASNESKNQKRWSAAELTIDPMSEERSTEIRNEKADTDLREEGEIRTLADVGHQANNLIRILRRF
jgi:hypothetical protein